MSMWQSITSPEVWDIMRGLLPIWVTFAVVYGILIVIVLLTGRPRTKHYETNNSNSNGVELGSVPDVDTSAIESHLKISPRISGTNGSLEDTWPRGAKWRTASTISSTGGTVPHTNTSASYPAKFK